MALAASTMACLGLRLEGLQFRIQGLGFMGIKPLIMPVSYTQKPSRRPEHKN
jgi:hypothetical protein